MAKRMLEIVYSDKRIVIVNKPGGLLAVPGRGPEKQDCVTNRIKKMFSDCIEQPAVHRLDMATSGLMVLALDAKAHRDLSIQFSERRVEKKYIALLEGEVARTGGEITLRFRLDTDNRPYQVYDPVLGKSGTTHWQRLALEGDRTRIEFTPITGRTHQLRLHAAHELGLGCPIVGDSLYGSCRFGDPMLLHATKLSFVYPENGKRLTFSSPAPF